MKYLKTIIFTLLYNVFFVSCTTNDGDIGSLFGIWSVEQIVVDGEPDVAYVGNLVWKFQGGVLLMQEVEANHEIVNYWSSWSRKEDLIIVSTRHVDSGDTDPYGFPPALHLPVHAIVEFRVLSDGGRRVTLSYESESFGPIICELVKLI